MNWRKASTHADFNDLVFRSHMTYKNGIFNNISREKDVCIQSDIQGVIFRECKFTMSNFERSSFEANRIEKCVFDGVNVRYGDMLSLIITETTFVGCSFESVEFCDCMIKNCRFIECNFTGTHFSKNDVEKTEFRACFFSRGMHSLNKYAECVFKDMTLGDCTFLEIIFRGCNFKNITINADALGETFGITRDNIEHANFCYRGIFSSMRIDDPVAAARDTYERESWQFPWIILSMNFGYLSRYTTLQMLLEHLISEMKSGNALKKTRLEFVGNIFSELHDLRELPLFSLVHSINAINQYFLASAENLNCPAHFCDEELRALQRKLFDLYRERSGRRWVSSICDVPNFRPNEPMLLKISFDRQYPEKSSDLFASCLKHVGTENPGGIRFLGYSTGSVVETIALAWSDIPKCLDVIEGLCGCFLGIHKIFTIFQKGEKKEISASERENEHESDVEEVYVEFETIHTERKNEIQQMRLEASLPRRDDSMQITIKSILQNPFPEEIAIKFQQYNQNSLIKIAISRQVC